MQFRSGISVGFRGLFLGRKAAKETLPFIKVNMGDPLAPAFVPADSLITAGIVPLLSRVKAILTGGGFSQICAPVVQSIPVSMVNKKAFRLSHDFPMHINQPAAATLPAGGVSGMAQRHGIPSMRPDLRGIRCINDGFVTLGERNVSCVAFNARRTVPKVTQFCDPFSVSAISKSYNGIAAKATYWGAA